MPAFENYTLREINVRKVDQFIKKLASAKSYSTAKQARTVLSLAFGLAVRYDALKENPVRGIAKMHRPPSQAMALTSEQVEAVRSAVRSWRRGDGLSGPKPDGQLEQIIEMMLGTSGRIGEVLAIRKCDVDVTKAPATVRICGTIISPAGKPSRLRHRRHRVVCAATWAIGFADGLWTDTRPAQWLRVGSVHRRWLPLNRKGQEWRSRTCRTRTCPS